jgi:seryl-tRNA synthetase
MLDLKFIRDNADLVRQAIANRNTSAPLDDILKLDQARREKLAGLEEMHHARKESSREKREAGAEQGRELRDKIRALEEEVKVIDDQLRDLLLQMPNIPQASVPVGKTEEDNVIVGSWGVPRKFDFEPKPHWTLGEALDIIDFERGVKLSGTRFYVLKGMGARLQRALIAFMLDLHTKEHGFKEIYPPYMVKKEIMVGSGNLPKFADNLYHDAEDDMWFVPTAEVPLTGLHRDEIIPAGVLPLHYVAYTACFRREQMSAGKDTRGIKRGHQFDKVEMYKFTEPEKSHDELETMRTAAENVLRKLNLPYRIKLLNTSDMGFGSSKTYDLEVWAPGCNEWLEVSSCSNCLDFQARRSNIRYRATSDAKAAYVHTLNGSGVALPRSLIAVMENYQQADGSIVVPEVLQDFMGTKTIK